MSAEEKKPFQLSAKQLEFRAAAKAKSDSLSAKGWVDDPETPGCMIDPVTRESLFFSNAFKVQQAREQHG